MFTLDKKFSYDFSRRNVRKFIILSFIKIKFVLKFTWALFFSSSPFQFILQVDN